MNPSFTTMLGRVSLPARVGRLQLLSVPRRYPLGNVDGGSTISAQQEEEEIVGWRSSNFHSLFAPGA